MNEEPRMIKGRLIVCIASSWDYDPTCKHQIMKILARANDIAWINYHGTRRPRINGRDIRAALAALRRSVRGIQPVSASMVQSTPLVIPGATHSLLARANHRLMIGHIRKAVRCLDPDRRKPLQVWAFAPDVSFLRGRLDEECFLYYCTDDYTKFEGFDVERIRAAEEETLRSADVVVTTSAELRNSRGTIRPDAALVPHGVDYDHFAGAWRNPPNLPSDLGNIADPIFGFFGLIHDWVDLDLLAEVARRRPGYSFVLLGDCLVDAAELRRLPNVHLLGRRPYAKLPAYCAAFRAGLLLFKRNEMTRSVNPIKMYEYLAAGLPIISTSIPEALRCRGPVVVADTPEDFTRACDQFALAPSPADRNQTSQTVRDQTWESRVELLSSLVRQPAIPRSGNISNFELEISAAMKVKRPAYDSAVSQAFSPA